MTLICIIYKCMNSKKIWIIYKRMNSKKIRITRKIWDSNSIKLIRVLNFRELAHPWYLLYRFDLLKVVSKSDWWRRFIFKNHFNVPWKIPKKILPVKNLLFKLKMVFIFSKKITNNDLLPNSFTVFLSMQNIFYRSKWNCNSNARWKIFKI